MSYIRKADTSLSFIEGDVNGCRQPIVSLSRRDGINASGIQKSFKWKWQEAADECIANGSMNMIK